MDPFSGPEWLTMNTEVKFIFDLANQSDRFILRVVNAPFVPAEWTGISFIRLFGLILQQLIVLVQRRSNFFTFLRPRASPRTTNPPMVF